jgi:diguanylate cyclase (GGDEF)-like protein
VPVTEYTRPNEYLDAEDKNVTDSEGRMLTAINPAYMTRQLSELAAKAEGVRFRITSLDRIGPENAPTSREAAYLEAFESDQSARGEVVDRDGDLSFFYMAPLITEEACLKCHENQGYEVGDVRGAISVEVPYGQYHTEEVILLTDAGLLFVGFVGIAGFFQRLQRHYADVEHHARYDSLTKLPNRRTLLDELDREFKYSQRKGTPFSLVMIDIDRFKAINDTYGHETGDRCLESVAKELEYFFYRLNDVVGRLGGEEFVAFLSHTDGEQAERLAEKLRARIASLNFTACDQKAYTFTVSLGVCSRNPSDESATDLLARTDAQLYRAKSSGRNLVCRA